ncbi:MAG: hypothetical protein N2C14_10535 [Planctomycetales bacterium]
MRRLPRLVIGLSVALLVLSANRAGWTAPPEANPNQELHQFLTGQPNLMGEVKKLGMLVIALGQPEREQLAVTGWLENHWSTKPGLKWKPDALEKIKANQKEALARLSHKMQEDQVGDTISLVGFDMLGVIDCFNVHYLAVGDSGPILITLSAFKKERVKVKDVQFTDKWDVIKRTLREADYTARDKVPSVTWELDDE